MRKKKPHKINPLTKLNRLLAASDSTGCKKKIPFNELVFKKKNIIKTGWAKYGDVKKIIKKKKTRHLSADVIFMERI